jgi:hypothetical protein
MLPKPTVLLRHIRRLVPEGEDVTGADLLRRFAASRDDAAFAAVVRRRGPR